MIQWLILDVSGERCFGGGTIVGYAASAIVVRSLQSAAQRHGHMRWACDNAAQLAGWRETPRLRRFGMVEATGADRNSDPRISKVVCQVAVVPPIQRWPTVEETREHRWLRPPHKIEELLCTRLVHADARSRARWQLARWE